MNKFDSLVSSLLSENNKNFKVIVTSQWQKPENHYFDSLEQAKEFAKEMKDQQYKTEIVDLSEEPEED